MIFICFWYMIFPDLFQHNFLPFLTIHSRKSVRMGLHLMSFIACECAG